jgi:hypothetical protein
MESYSREAIEVSVCELYNTKQATLLAVLEFVYCEWRRRRMKGIICVKHGYIDQLGITPCPDCQPECDVCNVEGTKWIPQCPFCGR